MPPEPSLPRIGPCSPWITAADVEAMEYPSDVTVDTATAQLAAEVATEVLYNLSGQQFSGDCGPVVVRPISRPTDADTRGLVSRLPAGYIAVWGWSSAWGQPASGAASHYGSALPPEVELGAYPVTLIVRVKIDGEVIPPSEYYLQDRRKLIRRRPYAAAEPTARYGWPTTQIMDLPDTEPGTFSVTYKYGTPPPATGVLAAKRLAQQLTLNLVGEDSVIPQRYTSINRAGETIQAVDVMDFFEKRLTGIYEVDLFLRTFNPSGAIRRPLAWSPDVGRPRPTPAGA